MFSLAMATSTTVSPCHLAQQTFEEPTGLRRARPAHSPDYDIDISFPYVISPSALPPLQVEFFACFIALERARRGSVPHMLISQENVNRRGSFFRSNSSYYKLMAA